MLNVAHCTCVTIVVLILNLILFLDIGIISVKRLHNGIFFIARYLFNEIEQGEMTRVHKMCLYCNKYSELIYRSVSILV